MKPTKPKATVPTIDGGLNAADMLSLLSLELDELQEKLNYARDTIKSISKLLSRSGIRETP